MKNLLNLVNLQATGTVSSKRVASGGSPEERIGKIRVSGDPSRDQNTRFEGDLEDLQRELDHFQKEKERIRAIVGQIGGVPKMQAKILNAVFVAVIVISLIVSVVGGEGWRLLMIEIATVALAAKIIYLIHAQMRVAHFEFWILSSLEWRSNEIVKQLRELNRARSA